MELADLVKKQKQQIEELQKLLDEMHRGNKGKIDDTLKDFQGSTAPAVDQIYKVAESVGNMAKGLEPIIRVLSKLDKETVERLLKE